MATLSIKRKRGESLVLTLGETLATVTISETHQGWCQVVIDAPLAVRVSRGELPPVVDSSRAKKGE